MEKKKKTFVIVLAVVALLLILCGLLCFGFARKVFISIQRNGLPQKYGSNYNDYFLYMLPELENFDDDPKFENDKEIKIWLGDISKNSSDYEVAFAEALDAHNAFVAANPTYFTDDMTIIYANSISGGNTTYRVSNTLDFYGISGDCSEIDYGNTNEMIYGEVRAMDADEFSLPEGSCSRKIKVIYVDMTGSSPAQPKCPLKDFYFLSAYPNLEKVVFYTKWEYDENEEFYDAVMRDYPDLEIYTTVYDKDLIRYEKK